MKMSYIYISLIAAALIGLFLLLRKKKGEIEMISQGNESNGDSGSSENQTSEKIPRGVRNNNFGNIKYSTANDWRGKVPYSQNTDKVFEQFTSPEYGARAQMILLRNYNKSGLHSVDAIISRYAPPIDLELGVKNSTKNYIDTVASGMGISPTQKIDLNDKDTLVKLAWNMGLYENGNYRSVTKAIYERAYSLI